MAEERTRILFAVDSEERNRILVDGIPACRSPVPEEPLHFRGVARISETRVEIVPDEIEKG